MGTIEFLFIIIIKNFCGICGLKIADGTNAVEFKTGWAYQIGNVSFHGQATVKCNTKAFSCQTSEQMHNL